MREWGMIAAAMGFALIVRYKEEKSVGLSTPRVREIDVAQPRL